MKKVILLAALLLTTACSSHLGPQFTPTTVPVSNDYGTAVFYRPTASIFMSPGWSRFAISVDGQRVTGVGEDTYSIVQMPAGKHKINAQTPNIDDAKEFDIKAGQVHYFKTHVAGAYMWKYILIDEIPEQQALKDLAGMKEQINPDKWVKKVLVENHDHKGD